MEQQTLSPLSSAPPLLSPQPLIENSLLQRQTADLTSTEAKKKKSRSLLLEHHDNILTIKINRPQYKNALNRSVVYELIAAIGQATHNNDIKLVVITGVGDTFCAGNDLKQIRHYNSPNHYFIGANYIHKALVSVILNCPKILVCVVNGACIGIGFTMAALCDIVYCTRNAYFQAPFTQLGLCPEACSSITFPQIFGPSWTSKLLLFNEKLSAEKAETLGFVAEVFADERDVADNLDNKLLAYSKLPWDSVRITKRLIRLHNQAGLMRALDNELKEIEKLRKSPVHQEALKTFMARSIKKNQSKL